MTRGVASRALSPLKAIGGVWADAWMRSGWRVQIHATSGKARLINPAGKTVFKGDERICLRLGRTKAPKIAAHRAVVLLHGLGRGKQTMSFLEHTLHARGWVVANMGYPSLTLPVHDHAARAAAVASALQEDGAEEVAFVGHSLGGIVSRIAMASAGIKGRLVTLGSPNQGSSIADKIKNFPPFRIFVGHCAHMVTTYGIADVPVPKGVDIAVVAGGNGGRGYNPVLSGDNDGIVRVSETRLGTAESDFLLIPSVHSFLPSHHHAVAATVSFLETGSLAVKPA